MSECQLHLFDPPKPLVERFGEEFFRNAPREPGVYVMTGQDECVLYIGQSGNLRARLASYKNARPDRSPRKVVRLVRQVKCIAYERCESPQAARLRENELLRLHRPKFNAMNTYPKAYSFFWLRCDGQALDLGRTNDPKGADACCDSAPAEWYGAFKTRCVAAHGALLRLIWAALYRPASPHDFPGRLLGSRLPREYRIGLGSGESGVNPELLVATLRTFFRGDSASLIALLEPTVPPPESLCFFQRAFHSNDLETLKEFFRSGPKRNRSLKQHYGLGDGLIPQEELDDLLVDRTAAMGAAGSTA
jgi:predicted GIY-YIG superfamily endonuclease